MSGFWRYLNDAWRMLSPHHEMAVAMTLYKAPWSLSVILVTWITTGVLCIGSAVAVTQPFWFIAPLLMAIPLGAAPFTIRSYTLTTDAILVRRLFWTTRLPLDGLQSAVPDPEAMSHSTRTAGNGGLFSLTGYFSNPKIGDYRALVMNPKLAVVLKYANEIILLSPEFPERFAANLTQRLPKQ